MVEKNLFNECSRKIKCAKKTSREFRSLILAFNYLAQAQLFLMNFIQNEKHKKDLDFYLLAHEIYLNGFKNFLDYFNLKIEPLLFIGILLQNIKDHAEFARYTKGRDALHRNIH